MVALAGRSSTGVGDARCRTSGNRDIDRTCLMTFPTRPFHRELAFDCVRRHARSAASRHSSRVRAVRAAPRRLRAFGHRAHRAGEGHRRLRLRGGRDGRALRPDRGLGARRRLPPLRGARRDAAARVVRAAWTRADRTPRGVGRTRDLRSDDIILLDGVRVTTPLRTAADLLCLLPRREALAAADALMREHGFTRADLRRLLVRIPPPWRCAGTPARRDGRRSVPSRRASPGPGWRSSTTSCLCRAAVLGAGRRRADVPAGPGLSARAHRHRVRRRGAPLLAGGPGSRRTAARVAARPRLDSDRADEGIVH